MQYCPNCMIQIRGRKARCPLCQRELMDPDSWTEPEPRGIRLKKNRRLSPHQPEVKGKIRRLCPQQPTVRKKSRRLSS